MKDMSQVIAELTQRNSELMARIRELEQQSVNDVHPPMRLKRALTPRDVAEKKWTTLPWGEKWSRVFGFPADNASWFISGASASGKSSFVMQLGKELCRYGTVLYLSYEEGVNQSFQRRMGYLKMHEVQGRFRVVVGETYDEVVARLKRAKSPKFVVVDSIQRTEWEYRQIEELVTVLFPRKCFIFVSMEYKSQPMGKPAMKTKYLADMKVRVVGYKAYCQGRSTGDSGIGFVVWEEGVIKSTNNINGL